MLKLVNNWFAPRANPIGIDFGSDSLRLAQVQQTDGEFKLIAAASCDVPAHVRTSLAARLEFFTGALKDLLAQGRFRGRQAILAMPAASMFIQHLRVPRTDEESLRKTLPFEARGKIPIDPANAVLRHIVAGDIFSEQDPRSEVIVMAAQRALVDQLLDAAARAKLDVIGMNIEPSALIDCFSHVYRRKTDQEVTNCFLDIGCTATRAVIARGDHVLFARSVPVGGDHFTRAVASAMKIGFDQAKLLRLQSATAAGTEMDRHQSRDVTAPPAANPEPAAGEEMALLNAATRRAAPATPPPADAAPAPAANDPRRQLEQAVLEPLNKLVDELNLCRRYHEATFPNKPVDRLIFVGGEARHRWQCLTIARQMQLAAQIGDPLVRMGRTTEVGIESGIDRRQPQPGWAVAIGLSMGPARAATTEHSTERGAA